MRSLVLASVILLGATSSAAADPPQPVEFQAPARLIEPFPAECPSLAGQPTARPDDPLKPRKLTDLAPAEAYHAVLRSGANGCPDPLMVGYQYRPKP